MKSPDGKAAREYLQAPGVRHGGAMVTGLQFISQEPHIARWLVSEPAMMENIQCAR
jgi:hypothetical protein